MHIGTGRQSEGLDVEPGEETVDDRFERLLAQHGLAPLVAERVDTLQVNLTYRCNLACHHCHVESGPKRTEALRREDCERIVWLLERSPDVRCLDLTGGAPELHPEFRTLVERARALGRTVIDRCNLTVFFEPGQEDTPEFLARHGVHVMASLPCYSEANVEGQRGRGVFDASIEALRRLNALGYGKAEGRTDAGEPGALVLDLIYNPTGPFLPPAQSELEADYRRELGERFGIRFDSLLTITNMPIKRFARDLERDDQAGAYAALLREHFNPATVPGLMCRHQISVDPAGRLYDCDFNQALGLACTGSHRTIHDVEHLGELSLRRIRTAAHCFGCTAGAGSSCGGALQ